MHRIAPKSDSWFCKFDATGNNVIGYGWTLFPHSCALNVIYNKNSFALLTDQFLELFHTLTISRNPTLGIHPHLQSVQLRKIDRAATLAAAAALSEFLRQRGTSVTRRMPAGRGWSTGPLCSLLPQVSLRAQFCRALLLSSKISCKRKLRVSCNFEARKATVPVARMQLVPPSTVSTGWQCAPLMLILQGCNMEQKSLRRIYIYKSHQQAEDKSRWYVSEYTRCLAM